MNPSTIPSNTEHLDDQEIGLLNDLHGHLEAERYQEAQDAAEDLWRLSIDAHKRLWQGVSNALTAVCARELGHIKGAQEIAARTHEMLAPYPRMAVGLDLDLLLTTMDQFVTSGNGRVQAKT